MTKLLDLTMSTTRHRIWVRPWKGTVESWKLGSNLPEQIRNANQLDHQRQSWGNPSARAVLKEWRYHRWKLRHTAQMQANLKQRTAFSCGYNDSSQDFWWTLDVQLGGKPKLSKGSIKKPWYPPKKKKQSLVLPSPHMNRNPGHLGDIPITTFRLKMAGTHKLSHE